MKEYVIPASEIVTGYRRLTRTRTEDVWNHSGTSYSSWSSDYTSNVDDTSNRIKYKASSSRTFQKHIAKSDGSDIGNRYLNTQKQDNYRIDMRFDISGVPSNRIQSVALRANLIEYNDKTPLGYKISTVGKPDGTFSASYAHFQPQSLLGTCNLGTPTVPYSHDTVLSGLSDTGWYTLWNESGTGFASDEDLAFGMEEFYLVITTDEAGGSSYTITYDKGTYGTGENQTATKTADVAIRLLGAIFTRTDYTQTGWSVNADGSTKDYSLNENYIANANITLYPYWTEGYVATGNVLFIMTANGLRALF